MLERVRDHLFGVSVSLALAGGAAVGFMSVLIRHPSTHLMLPLVACLVLGLTAAFCVRCRPLTTSGIITAIVLYVVAAAVWWGAMALLAWAVYALVPGGLIVFQLFFALVGGLSVLGFVALAWAALIAWVSRPDIAEPPTTS